MAATGFITSVIEREIAGGCLNTAAAGGIDRWLRGIRAPLRLPELPFGGYAALDPPTRRAWCDRALAALAAEIPTAAPAAPPKLPTVAAAGHPPTRNGRAAHPRGGARGSIVGEARARYDAPTITPASPVADLPGVGPTTARALARSSLTTVAELLALAPRRYLDLSRPVPIVRLEPGTGQTVIARVYQTRELRLGRRMRAAEAMVTDGTDFLRVLWFNQPFIAGLLHPGDRVVVHGRVRWYGGRRQMESPLWETLPSDAAVPPVLPMYRLVEGVSQRRLRQLVASAVELAADRMTDIAPGLAGARGLPGAPAAVRWLHCPDDHAQVRLARRRLAYDTLLTLSVAAVQRKQERGEEGEAPALVAEEALAGRYAASLPFRLTAAQRRVTGEVFADLRRTRPMARLLQGDVGSGKTAVALAAMLAAVAEGRQAALMAPSEVLAGQHLRTLVDLLGGRPSEVPLQQVRAQAVDRDVRIAFLTGALGQRERTVVLRSIESGEADIVVGTHALIQERVAFARLALAVVDEQHRFGVLQRAALRAKGGMPHVLVMTATPIPRTLLITMYGDLDVSLLDELPPGRTPVETHVLEGEGRARAYQRIRDEAARGRQAFVICPLVEESDAVEARAAVAEFKRLQHEELPRLRLALLHGRMKGVDKDAVMRAFAAGQHDVLVSTSVVEVGVDVPNATVTAIEGADRFGLAQLHQMRGRVGRGSGPAACYLLVDDPSDEALRRLEALVATNDGLELAEQDFWMRGPGEYFGTRQSGGTDVVWSLGLQDRDLLDWAREDAERLLAIDPGLEQPSHAALAGAVSRVEAFDERH